MGEQRLVDANAFYKQLEEIRAEYIEENTMSSIFAAEIIETVQDSYLKDAQTIDPVRHGKWEFCSQDIYGMSGYFKCSACYSMLPTDHSRTNYKQKVPFDYCPYCGAKMDGDKNV